MEMLGEYRIPASRQVVWEALNDPMVLKASIAGCEELEQDGNGGFTAKVRAKIGPVSARFSGKVSIIDPDPPNGYRIEGEGTGGAAGFAKGGATISLEEDGSETVLTYAANASVGGKLAQIGSRLVDGTAKKMSEDFFEKFCAIVVERAALAGDGRLPEAHGDTEGVGKSSVSSQDTALPEEMGKEAAVPTSEREERGGPAGKGVSNWVWIGAAALALIGALIYFS